MQVQITDYVHQENIHVGKKNSKINNMEKSKKVGAREKIMSWIELVTEWLKITKTKEQTWNNRHIYKDLAKKSEVKGSLKSLLERW